MGEHLSSGYGDAKIILRKISEAGETGNTAVDQDTYARLLHEIVAPGAFTHDPERYRLIAALDAKFSSFARHKLPKQGEELLTQD